MRSSAFPRVFLSLLLPASSLAYSEVTVKDAWVRGTVAAQIFVGLVFILGFSFVAQAINLKAMSWILRVGLCRMHDAGVKLVYHL